MCFLLRLDLIPALFRDFSNDLAERSKCSAYKSKVFRVGTLPADVVAYAGPQAYPELNQQPYSCFLIFTLWTRLMF